MAQPLFREAAARGAAAFTSRQELRHLFAAQMEAEAQGMQGLPPGSELLSVVRQEGAAMLTGGR